MTTKEAQRVAYWLTPAGCAAVGGHTPRGDGTCGVCGADLDEVPC